MGAEFSLLGKYLKPNYYPDLMKVTVNLVIIILNYWNSTSENTC